MLTLIAGGLRVTDARAAGNASAAAGFVEDAQNKDGGFGAKHGAKSSPTPSLWATAALLAAGKNPRDEWVKGGRSAEDYLVANKSVFTSLTNLGLLTMIQSAAEAPASRYGNPAAKLIAGLTDAHVRKDPGGAALGILGLIADGSDQSKQAAIATGQELLSTPTSDGGWGTNGLSDSVSTALVLQALAASGVADGQNDNVQKGVAYLHKAQGNDGAIAASIRTDQALAGGSVAATAFAIQALDALNLPTLKTPTGTSLREGLTQYQQKTSGGLTSDGALYSQIPPSVIETAQAFPAFDGKTYPLSVVAATTSGPPKSAGATTGKRSSHVSGGTSAKGVSSASGAAKDSGAFKKSTAAPKGSGKQATAKQGSTTTSGGTAVSGDVVGTKDPQLTSRAGQDGGGLTSEQKAAIWLAAALVAFMGLGSVLDARRPRGDGRSGVAVAVGGSIRFVSAARARGSLAPFAVLLIGATLVVLPFSTQMWHRAPKGAAMIDHFAPYMTTARLNGYQLDVRQLDEGVREAAAKGPALQFPHAHNAAAARKKFASDDPEFTYFQRQWSTTHKSLLSLINPIQANQVNYEAVAALPSFKAFPWFFVIPGGLLAFLAALALLLPAVWRRVRWGVVVIGAGLLLAPVVFGMLDRAPKGAKLVDAFRTVETRKVVTRVQNDFGSIAIGQGALRTELIPALRKQGLSTAEINTKLPAVTTLDARWVKILNDLTPMIGVMSDNVTNFQAVAALPAFGLFPWFFLIPGLLILALFVLPRATSRLVARRRVTQTEPQAA